MASPFENPDLLRQIFEYEGMLPRHTSVSSTVYRVQEKRADEFQKYMDKEYPLWDQKVDSSIWLYLLNKALFNEDMEAYAAIFQSGVIHDTIGGQERSAAQGMLKILGEDEFQRLAPKYFPECIYKVRDLQHSIEIASIFGSPFQRHAISRDIMNEFKTKPITIHWLNNIIAEKYPEHWNQYIKDLDITDENNSHIARYVKAVALGLPIPANINKYTPRRQQIYNKLSQGLPDRPYTREQLQQLQRNQIAIIAQRDNIRLTAPFTVEHMIEQILRQ